MSEDQCSRRGFVRGLVFFGAASAVEGGTWLHEHTGHEPSGEKHCKLVDDLRSSASAEHAVQYFDDASTAALLAIYPNFFPRLMSSRRTRDVPEALESAASRIHAPKNPHRLVALPAIAAAHAISTTIGRGARECLWERITDTLGNPHREVREIVLQNLVTATLPSPDASDRWDVSDGLIEAVVRILQEAEEIPALLGAASIALTFLLNTRAILSHRGATALTRAVRVDRYIRAALRPRPVHFACLRRLKRAHESEFNGFDPHDVKSLPSHLTEMILQSRHARQASPQYNSELAIIHARLTYEVWRTMSGLSKASSTMTKTQAAVAFDKLTQFEAMSCLDKALGAWPWQPASHGDRKFQSFCRDVLLPQLNDFRELNQDCAHLVELRNLPHALSEYTWQSTADRLGSHTLAGVTAVLAALLVHFLFDRGMKNAESAPHVKLPEEQSDAIRQAVEDAHTVDRECGDELDAREREIGPARIRKPDKP